MQRTPLLSSRTPHVSCIHVSNELSLTITSSTMWKNFHLSFPGTSFSSLTGETCMIQPSACLSFRAAVGKQKAHSTHDSSFGELVCHYQVIAEWTYQKHLTVCIEIPVRFQIQSYDALTCTDSSNDSCLTLSRLTIPSLFDCLWLYVTRQRGWLITLCLLATSAMRWKANRYLHTHCV